MRKHLSTLASRRQAANAICRLAIGGLLLTIATVASAGKPTNVTAAEMALLPEYCPDAQFVGRYGDAYTNTSPNAAKWVGLMGKGFWAIHHYCWALINLARAQKPSMPANMRQWTRDGAIDDLKYVIENTTPDFIMLPEIYTKVGEILLLQKRPAEARDAFAKARALKPDYWPPYLQWAEFLRSTGRKADARKVVEEGLSYSPGAKSLQNLLIALGGDPASIPPRPSSPTAIESSDKVEPAQ